MQGLYTIRKAGARIVLDIALHLALVVVQEQAAAEKLRVVIGIGRAEGVGADQSNGLGSEVKGRL